jgi:RNA polymerase sigma-70 factor, ECF subfamily
MIHSARGNKSHNRSGMNVAICPASLNSGAKQAPAGRETEVMAAAQAGSAAAFDELQRLYAPRLYRTVLRITRNREDAEDAVQDAFLRAYVALGYFEARSSVYAWLTRIAINSALMILRKRRSRHEAFFVSPLEGLDHDPPFEVADTALNPEQWCDLCQRSDLVLYAIGKLEPTLRAPIEIQMAGEYSMQEIADTLKLSVTAVKARLHRARVHVIKRVSKHCRAKEPMAFRPADENTPTGREARERQRAA